MAALEKPGMNRLQRCASAMLWLVVHSIAGAATLTVTTAVDEDDGNALPGNGTGASLRECVKYSNAGDRVEFDASLSGATILLNLGPISIERSIEIDAMALEFPPIVSGDLNGNVFGDATDVTLLVVNLAVATDLVKIAGISLAGANCATGGSAISHQSGMLLVEDCLIIGNSASIGPVTSDRAAVHAVAPIEIQRVTIAYNDCLGMYSGVEAKIVNCTFCNNNGTGVLIGGGTANIDHCTFADNDKGILVNDGVVEVNHALLVNDFVSGSYTGSNNSSGNYSKAKLGSLAYYGGKTPTRPPLRATSPTLLNTGATSTSVSTDQRGFPRLVGSAVDIGAVEIDPSLDHGLQVTTAEDGVRGSLRMAAGLAESGNTITFHQSLAGQKFLLTCGLPNHRLRLNDDGSVGPEIRRPARAIRLVRPMTVDATSLSEPPVLCAGGSGISGASRIFIIDGNDGFDQMRLRNLVLQDGFADGPTLEDRMGGGILYVGFSLYCDRLSIRSCRATGDGGAVGSPTGKTLSLSNCLLERNRSEGQGGAVYQGNGGFDARNTTFHQNVSRTGGGAIRTYYANFFSSTFVGNECTEGDGGAAKLWITNLYNVTVVKNKAFGAGGGFQGYNVSLTGCLFGLNRASTNPDLDGTPYPWDTYLIGVDPKLAPLGDYGGPTPTMPPLPGSPAIDATGTLYTDSDQRGFSRQGDGVSDFGAVEFIPAHDYPLFWPVDTDDDGNVFGIEVALGTDNHAADVSSTRNLKLGREAGTGRPQLDFGFNSAAASTTIWIIKRSTTLAPGSFDEIYRYDGPTQTETFNGTSSIVSGDSIRVVDESPVPDGKAFYLFEAQHVPD